MHDVGVNLILIIGTYSASRPRDCFNLMTIIIII